MLQLIGLLRQQSCCGFLGENAGTDREIFLNDLPHLCLDCRKYIRRKGGISQIKIIVKSFFRGRTKG